MTYKTAPIESLKVGQRVLLDFAWCCEEEEGVSYTFDGVVLSSVWAGSVWIGYEVWGKPRANFYNGDPNSCGFTVQIVEED